MLYDREEDPGETNNLVGRYPEKVEKYQRLIGERFAADRDFAGRVNVVPGKKTPLTGDIRKELWALGYLN